MNKMSGGRSLSAGRRGERTKNHSYLLRGDTCGCNDLQMPQVCLRLLSFFFIMVAGAAFAA